MQTKTQIRQILDEAHLSPLKRFGQYFLIDGNLMQKLLELAELTGEETVLEVGPGTGLLTEELLERAERLVAVEVDRGLTEVLRRRLGNCANCANLVLLNMDVMAGKHALAPAVVNALAARSHMVSNLPYNIATPLVLQCLKDSWRAAHRPTEAGEHVLFERMTFMVQRELAQRLLARPGTKQYGSAGVVASLLGRIQAGAVVPPEAFWPKPKVAGRIMRIDFGSTGSEIASIEVLETLTSLMFARRRKQIGATLKRRDLPFDRGALAAALAAAGIDLTQRVAQIEAPQFAAVSNALACDG